MERRREDGEGRKLTWSEQVRRMRAEEVPDAARTRRPPPANRRVQRRVPNMIIFERMLYLYNLKSGLKLN